MNETPDSDAGLRVAVDGAGVATVTMDRPHIHNAFDDALIEAMTRTFRELDARDDVRAVVLAAEGRSFSAGADLNWMRRMAGYTEAENLEDARALAAMVEALDSLSKPTVAKVQGAAMGGGVGLVAACDIAVAAEDVMFALSEVRLGLIPAAISPFVTRAMGGRAARRYMLTGERFDAAEAHRLGLIHDVVLGNDLDDAVTDMLRALLKAGPGAQAVCKRLIRTVEEAPLAPALHEHTAGEIARLRVSPEGQEGLAAFLEKRKPAFVKD